MASNGERVNYRLNTSNVVSDTIDGEVLAIRSDTGAYYSMRGSAATSWVALLSGADLDEVAALVAAHHGADPAIVRTQVESFAGELAAEALLVGADPTDAGSVAVLPVQTRGMAWEAPVVERYTDMRDLLLFDPIHEVEASGWPAVKPPSSE